MSTILPNAEIDREELAPGFGIVVEDPLTLHNPERAIVIDVVDRQESHAEVSSATPPSAPQTDEKAERTLTDTYRYRVEVAQNQRTEYCGVFPDRETAERKARKLTHDY